MKNSNDTIRNQTRHLLACSTLPQPNALPHAPIQQLDILNYNLISIRFWPRFQGLVECHKMRSEVLKVVIMMLLVTLVQPL